MQTVLRHNFRTRGFTLIEAAFTTMIVGIGVVAMLQLIAAGTVSNVEGVKTTTGINIAKGLREKTLTMSFNQVRSLNGMKYSPPIDGRGAAIEGFEHWRQIITVQPVDPDKLNTNNSSTHPAALRESVKVQENDLNIYE